MDAIVALARRALSESWYREVPPNEAKFRKLVIFLMTSAQHVAYVAEREGEVQGILLGVTDQIFFSTRKSATDILTYTTPEAAGLGRALVNKFVAWAKARPDVYQIVLSVSTGMHNAKRVGRIYERAGLVSAGGSYAWYRGIHE